MTPKDIAKMTPAQFREFAQQQCAPVNQTIQVLREMVPGMVSTTNVDPKAIDKALDIIPPHVLIAKTADLLEMSVKGNMSMTLEQAQRALDGYKAMAART